MLKEQLAFFGPLGDDWRRRPADGCDPPAIVAPHRVCTCVWVRCVLSFLFRLWRFPWGYYVGRTRRLTPHGLPPRISISIEGRECYLKENYKKDEYLSRSQRLFPAVPSRVGLRAGERPPTLLIRARRSSRTSQLFFLTRRRGANTAPTQMGRPTHEAPTREYTHKHTQTQTNAQRGPTKYGAGSRRGAALLIRGGCLAPTPSELHLCRDLPRRSYRMCTATERRYDCSASHVDVVVDQLTSFS